jgi:hypothetical protein
MKKTIALMAILATSTSAHALVRPDPNPKPARKICLSLHQAQDKSLIGGCDEAQNNVNRGRTLLHNGCAAGQVAIITTRIVQIESCMPPGIAQL